MNQDMDRSKAKERYAAGKMRQHSTRALFFIGGFGAASWAPLVPLLRERLAIGEDVLGMLLLCIGIGGGRPERAMPIRARRFFVSATFFALFLLVLCLIDSMVLAAVSLLIFGAMMGCIDVVVNIQAVLVEKASKRRLMSGMHALWSVGGFAGAGLFGIWVGTLGLTPFVSTCIAAGIMLATLAFFARHLLPFGGEGGGAMVAVPKGIVTFVGVVACIAFLVEGAIMDWSGVFLTAVRGFDMSLAGTGFTVFSAAMLTMRLIGDRLVQEMGQKRVILGGSLLALAGFLPAFSEERFASLRQQLEAFGCGIELTLLSAIPAGSGLGTSSILAATVLGAVSDFCSLAWDKNEIGKRTLVLEQLLTTGGGWQDQFGGVLSGAKLLQTERGFVQNPTVRWLPSDLYTQPEYRQCHLLYYTGITRTAKQILAEIVRRMFLNNRDELRILRQMKEHAMNMYEALQRQDFQLMGRLVRKTWQQNQLIDSGTNPDAVRQLTDLVDDLSLGYKLPGAGGGGYLYMVAKDPEAAARIKQTLNENRQNQNARFVDMTLSEKGLQVSRS